jgi:hypothetical protein
VSRLMMCVAASAGLTFLLLFLFRVAGQVRRHPGPGLRLDRGGRRGQPVPQPGGAGRAQGAGLRLLPRRQRPRRAHHRYAYDLVLHTKVKPWFCLQSCAPIAAVGGHGPSDCHVYTRTTGCFLDRPSPVPRTTLWTAYWSIPPLRCPGTDVVVCLAGQAVRTPTTTPASWTPSSSSRPPTGRSSSATSRQASSFAVLCLHGSLV